MNNTVSPESPPLDSPAHLGILRWEVRPPRPEGAPLSADPPGPAGLTSPRPRSSTFRPRVQVQFPTGGPEGSEPARASLSRNLYRARGSGDLIGPDAPLSGDRGTATKEPRPTRPRLPGAGQLLISAARSARPGTTASAGPTEGHAQCGSEPRPRQLVRVAACSPAPRGT